MIDIAKLLTQLDEVCDWASPLPDVGHLISLCKQASAAIRELQKNERGRLVELGRGLETLGKGLQQHA